MGSFGDPLPAFAEIMTLQGATRLLRWPAHVEAFPLHRPSWHNYVVDLVGAGRDDEAERVARRALQLYPDVLDEGEGLRPLRERLKRREPARATLSANEIERRVGRVVDARYTLLGVQAQSEGQVLFHGLRLEDGVQVTLRWLRDVPPSAARRLFDAQRSAEQLPAACARPIDVVKDEDGEWLQVFRRLVGAEPLSALVAAGRLAPHRTATLLADLARIGAALHAAGLVHGDMRPDNVLARSDGSVVLLGTAPETLSAGGATLPLADERLRWSAPEEATRAGVTLATDVYKFGLLASMLQTGETPPALTERLEGREVRVPADAEGLVPSPEVIRRCVSLDPARRYDDLGAVAAALQSAPRAAATYGRYRVLREIGQGGFGTVFEAEHSETQQRAAVKVLHPHLARTAPMRQQFLREAKVIAQLAHEHIVRIYDADVSEGEACYIATEFLEGQTLAEALRAAGHLPWPRVADIGSRIARALRYAHERQVIHRDMKPENVFLARVGDHAEVVKVLDFGIARLRHDALPRAVPQGTARLEDHGGNSRGATTRLDGGAETLRVGAERTPSFPLTVSGQLVGTPAYMAPEMWHRRMDVSAAVDVYALGVLLYECGEGRLPFADALLPELRQAHLTREPPPLAHTAPASLEALLRRMLDKEPERRPTMREVVEALTLATEASPPREPPRRWRPLRTASLAVAAVGAVALAAYGAWSRWHEVPRPVDPGSSTPSPETAVSFPATGTALEAAAWTPKTGPAATEYARVRAWFADRVLAASRGERELLRLPVRRRAGATPVFYVATEETPESALGSSAGPVQLAKLDVSHVGDRLVELASVRALAMEGYLDPVEAEAGGVRFVALRVRSATASTPELKEETRHLIVMLDGAALNASPLPLEDGRPWFVSAASVRLDDTEAELKAASTVETLKRCGYADAETFDSRRAVNLFCCYAYVTVGRFATEGDAVARAADARANPCLKAAKLTYFKATRGF